MATNTAKRLDKIERGLRDLLEKQQPPIYVADGEDAPEGAIRIKMVWVDAEVRPEEPHLTLPPVPRSADPLPGPETEADRQKRWNAHLKAIAKDRYYGDEPRPVQPWESIV